MNRTISAVIIESYNRGENQIITACGPAGSFHFLYLPACPDVSFGDTILMNFNPQEFFIHHGNPHLTYRIFPLEFPGTLLLELVSERLSEEEPK